jgi:hypothetical protein
MKRRVQLGFRLREQAICENDYNGGDNKRTDSKNPPSDFSISFQSEILEIW